MCSGNVAHEKHLIRTRMKSLREAIDVHTYRTSCLSIQKKCKSLYEWNTSRIIHIYVSAVNNEVDTLGLIFDMFQQGKKVVVPKCMPGKHSLSGIRIHSLDELKPSKFGVMEPDYDPAKEVNPDRLDMVIVPLLAFDRNGGRIGFGAGYYDSLLSRCKCPSVGFAYAFQEVERVPIEKHDRTLTTIITDNEIIRM